MSYLRRISTARLLALCAAALALIVGGTAIALAASSGGPTPPRKPLAKAVHAALAAPDPQGVTARIEFTNHLVDGVDLRGSNPLLSGATGRLWATDDGRFRLELQSDGGDAQVVSDGKHWWAYDGSSNTVYRGTVPQDKARHESHANHVPTVTRIQAVINRVMKHASVTGPTPTNIAGEPAYSVRLAPKRDGGLLGAISFAWDASHGTPLDGAVYARGSSDPVLELKATDISFGPVDPSTFAVPAPSAAHTQNISPPRDRGHRGTSARRHPVTGLARVRRHAGFTVSAPASLAGRKRQSVTLAHGGTVIVSYGRGLNGIAVIEKRPGKAGARDNGPLGHAQLPTVSIGGTSAQELSTPLGTVVRFQRGGVGYTVLASAPAALVESAARGL